MEASLQTLVEHYRKIRKEVSRLWATSTYFRVVSIVSGSLTAALTSRYLYIQLYRKRNRYPSGPMGLPLIGNAMNIFDVNWLKRMGHYGNVVSFMMTRDHALLINEPHIARHVYLDRRSLNLPEQFVTDEMAALGFAAANGAMWKERRQIISSNLMTTMTGSYVEVATNKFIQSKVFPVFDQAAESSTSCKMKPLFRPIGFNIVLQACFGKELSSLNDPVWLKFDAQQSANNSRAEMQNIIGFAFGENRMSRYLQKLLTGDSLLNGFNSLIDLIDEFSKDKDKNVALGANEDEDGGENSKQAPLFEEFIEEYVSRSDGKWTRRHLLGDMMLMFFAATDTTYSALSYALLLAAKYPHIQQELYEELMAAFGDVDGVELKNKGISKIPKLRAFIHETLRIHPPVPAAGFRQILEPGLVIEDGGRKFEVRRSTQTLVNIIGIGRNPKYWVQGYNEE
eukprot:CAMPEP_0197022912 /NCGR_PEP_ID=MMETSP1384-20130603/3712_1 /TAXON_ID=29189 /ORGANISM="Ammonia sp." /LENGTH=452 /DNA_ID=CAMNT_0042451033 /DNA_START=49 /DNA_END=1404 /DNA_ORIENTATION=-